MWPARPTPVSVCAHPVRLPSPQILLLVLLSSDGFCLNSFSKFKEVPALFSKFDWGKLWSADAAWVIVIFFSAQVVLERLLPCEPVEGCPLRGVKASSAGEPAGYSPHPANGTKLKYRVNGHLAFWLTLFAMERAMPVPHKADHAAALVPMGPGAALGFASFFSPTNATWVYDNYLQLAFASVVFSTLLRCAALVPLALFSAAAVANPDPPPPSLYLYASSFRQGALLCAHGISGSRV
jgi:hypothetical protein